MYHPSKFPRTILSALRSHNTTPIMHLYVTAAAVALAEVALLPIRCRRLAHAEDQEVEDEGREEEEEDGATRTSGKWTVLTPA